jgi:hypothetical protein
MLLPRPEIRIATRFGSRIVGRGPVLWRIPRSRRACDGAAAPAFFDLPNPEGVKLFLNRFCILGGDDHNHPNAAIEGPRHFLGLEPSALLKKRENRGQVPPVNVYYRVAMIRKNPWNILEKSTAGNVS